MTLTALTRPEVTTDTEMEEGTMREKMAVG